MRRIAISSIAALATMGFVAAAQADGDCGWGHQRVAETPKPAVTADSAKHVPQTVISTKKSVAQTAKATKSEKGS